MTRKNTAGVVALALAAVSLVGATPGTAFAQDWRREAENRQKTKNDWRNLALAAGGVAIYGLIRKDPYIGFGGLAGALYSLNRYEQDRKSQSQLERARASFFDRPYFYRDGKRYERRTVKRNGQKFYQFVRQ
jgi:hypothetical protein